MILPKPIRFLRNPNIYFDISMVYKLDEGMMKVLYIMVAVNGEGEKRNFEQPERNTTRPLPVVIALQQLGIAP